MVRKDRTVMIPVCVSALLLCCFCELGCQENDIPLDRLLSANGLDDVTVPGQHEDCLLYQDDVVRIWFRRLVDKLPTVRNRGRNLGTIYVFAKGEHIATIPADAWAVPFWPLVRKLEDGGILLISYRPVSPPQPDSTPTLATNYCAAQVHHIDDRSCKLSYQTDIPVFRSLGQDRVNISYLTLLTDIRMRGKVMLAQIEYQASFNQEEIPVTMSCVETLYWKAHSREFVSPTTTRPAEKGRP